jgi:hypothetical protein
VGYEWKAELEEGGRQIVQREGIFLLVNVMRVLFV